VTDYAIQRLLSFEYIGTTENIDAFVGQIARALGFGSNYQVMQLTNPLISVTRV
jgi:hypothetical protein